MLSIFTRHFQAGLRSELVEKMRSYQVYCREGWLKIKGQRVIPIDIMMESNGRLVLLEIESHRQDPSNNIAKIPFWLKRNPVDKKILVIQLFSPFYDKHKIKKGVSEELGKLIMERFKGKVHYRSMSFHPKLSFERFEAIYEKPLHNKKSMDIMIKETAEQIVKMLG